MDAMMIPVDHPFVVHGHGQALDDQAAAWDKRAGRLWGNSHTTEWVNNLERMGYTPVESWFYGAMNGRMISTIGHMEQEDG